MSGEILSYVLGALGGCGILAAYYGVKRLLDRARPDAERRAGLWLVNLGIVLVAVSLYFSIFGH